jgi:hypothetical protein
MPLFDSIYWQRSSPAGLTAELCDGIVRRLFSIGLALEQLGSAGLSADHEAHRRAAVTDADAALQDARRCALVLLRQAATARATGPPVDTGPAAGPAVEADLSLAVVLS